MARRKGPLIGLAMCRFRFGGTSAAHEGAFAQRRMVIAFFAKGPWFFFWNSSKNSGPIIGLWSGIGQERSAVWVPDPEWPTFDFSLGLDGSTFKEKGSTLLPNVQQPISSPISWIKRSTLVLAFPPDCPAFQPDRSIS